MIYIIYFFTINTILDYQNEKDSPALIERRTAIVLRRF